jgi:hypothetical protein
MRTLISVLLFIPLLTAAQQPVTPVISKDYLALIKADSPTTGNNPAANPIPLLRIKKPFASPYSIKSIRTRNNHLLILPAKTRWLTLGGDYTISTGISSVTTLPTDDPPIFRSAFTTRQSLSLQANIKRSRYYWTPIWAFSLKAGKTGETTVIPDNRNSSENISASVERYLGHLSIAGGYSYFSSWFSNDNSTGFLNRVYQNALETPTNNPWFVLQNNGHFADRTQQTGQLTLQKKQGHLNFGVINALDAVDDNSNMSLKPSTPFWPAGLIYTRRQNDAHYSQTSYIEFHFRDDDRNLAFTARLNNIYNDEKVKITYPANNYSYHRSTNDASLTLNTDYDGEYLKAGLNLGDATYFSSTSDRNQIFLPEISGYLSKYFFNNRFNAKLASSYTSFYSEPAINHSFSAFLLTQLTPQDAPLFAPTTEIQTFNNLSPMQHQEFTSWIQLDYLYNVSLRADFSHRNTKDNVFPVYENNQLSLKNLADTRYQSFELQLQVRSNYRPPQYFSINNSIAFYTWSDIVTRMANGYDDHPIAGFSTIYKALVKGQPVGVILVNNQHTIIGNPTPDFTLKFSHVAHWANFTLNLDWEYRKGGDVWNGTESALDHKLATSYIQKGDNLRVHTLSLGYDIRIRNYLQHIRLALYAQNLLLWSAYKGVDPNQLLYDQPGSGGLDFFNLPSTKTFGLSASFQF